MLRNSIKSSKFATMISIIRHIEYLMMFNDCVVIPGWGALIASYTPSHINGDTFCGPSRSIGFNASITHNDGLLATSLTRRHGMTFDEACRLITDNVTAFKNQLAGGNEVAFGHLGYFMLNKGGKMEFSTFPQSAIPNEFFGLSDLNLSSFREQATGAQPQAVVMGNIWRERFKAAASIAAIVGVGVLFSTPVIIDKSTQNASMNIIEVKAKPQTSITAKPVQKATPSDKQFTVIDNAGNETPVTVSKDISNEELQNDTNGDYLLVINTCDREKSAHKLIKSYAKRGVKTKVVTCGKRHHIVIAQSDSQSELRKVKKSLPDKFEKAWICKR